MIVLRLIIHSNFISIPDKELLTCILCVLDDQSWTGHETPSPWQRHYLPGLWYGTMLGQGGRCQGGVLCSLEGTTICLKTSLFSGQQRAHHTLLLQMSPLFLSSGENKNDYHLSNTYWVSDILQDFLF